MHTEHTTENKAPQAPNGATTRADSDARSDHDLPTVELTLFRKPNGAPISKLIAPGADGKPRSDGSGCRMSNGVAWRHRMDGDDPATELADAINTMRSDTEGRKNHGVGYETIFAVYDDARARGLNRAELLARLRNPRQALH